MLADDDDDDGADGWNDDGLADDASRKLTNEGMLLSSEATELSWRPALFNEPRVGVVMAEETALLEAWADEVDCDFWLAFAVVAPVDCCCCCCWLGAHKITLEASVVMSRIVPTFRRTICIFVIFIMIGWLDCWRRWWRPQIDDKRS